MYINYKDYLRLDYPLHYTPPLPTPFFGKTSVLLEVTILIPLTFVLIE
jgi:hypothetical protein